MVCIQSTVRNQQLNIDPNNHTQNKKTIKKITNKKLKIDLNTFDSFVRDRLRPFIVPLASITFFLSGNAKRSLATWSSGKWQYTPTGSDWPDSSTSPNTCGSLPRGLLTSNCSTTQTLKTPGMMARNRGHSA